MFKRLRYDIKVIKTHDPAARSSVEVFLLYSGLHAMIYHRFAHFLHKHGLKFLARFVSQFSRFMTGIEIHPGAQIGKGLFIDHGSGVVIGETTIIGDNCLIYQGATLGGTGKETGKRHPTLGNNIMIGSGARVLGPITIGDNAKIAAGAVVLHDVPANATAVGIPARVVNATKKCTNDDLDQIHIPDPMAQELCRLTERIEALEKKLAVYEQSEQSGDT